ncbi:MAG: glycerol kinase GlpK [Thermodesulfobacteriota bacterium]
MPRFIAALDQGTTSTRFIIFDQEGRIIGLEQKEHQQIFPRPGWMEHDPQEIWDNACYVMRRALAKTGIKGNELSALGVTNQRETALIWDKHTGQPYHRAIVWQCTRTRDICEELAQEGGQNRFLGLTGLPISTYFSGPKFKWILDQVPSARQAARKKEALLGTMESWLIWWLTGGPQGGAHVSDVTNASRTLLMNLHTLSWEDELLQAMDIPGDCLPRIVPCSDHEPWGFTSEKGPLQARIPVCGAVGDQQAALLGQTCFGPGQAKNTYGTGCFMLLHTGHKPVLSSHGLITSPAYHFRGREPAYCLEGSIAVAGALVQWLRDNLGLIQQAREIEDLAARAEDNAGVYIVPAFSGLLAPYWRSDARGVITGLTRYADKRHIARAALEACAYQTRDIVLAMHQDSRMELSELRVDGGMVENELLMQFQADILGVPVTRPLVTETTCLGAAYAAGLASGFWSGREELISNWREDKTWQPRMEAEQRERSYQGWIRAVKSAMPD